MKNLVCIKGGRIIDPANDVDGIGDVFIRNGKFVKSLTKEEIAQCEVIDASGLVVAPGLIDIHVHFREPGQTHKENIASGSRSGAAGGFTSVVMMPNTSPVADNPSVIKKMNDTVKESAVINVYPTGCLTIGMRGEQLAPMGSLKKEGIVAVTDDGYCVQNNEIMRRAVEYAKMFDLPVMDHCQDASMTQGSVMHEGEWSLKLGLKGWPAAAEDLIISRNVVLAKHTDNRIHMQHVSSKYGVDIIRRAKRRGINVSGEATPHHMFFTDANCSEYDTFFKMNPPLRSDEDREAIIEGVLDDSLEVIATDHAPHTLHEKDCEFDYAPFGIIGLETALPACLEVLYHSGKCDLPFLLKRMTINPAKVVGIDKGTLSIGSDADVVIFNPDEEQIIDANTFESKSTNCPWHGMKLRGKIKRTIVSGHTVWDGKNIIAK